MESTRCTCERTKASQILSLSLSFSLSPSPSLTPSLPPSLPPPLYTHPNTHAHYHVPLSPHLLFDSVIRLIRKFHCCLHVQAILRDFAKQREKHKRDMQEYSALMSHMSGTLPASNSADAFPIGKEGNMHARVEELKKCAAQYAILREQQVPILHRLNTRIQTLRGSST